MSEFIKIAGISIAVAILAGVMDQRDHSIAVALSLLSCALALCGCIQSFRPAADIIEELTKLSGLGGDYLEPMVKTAGIGIITQIACAICTDCGQNALSRMSELCGTAAAICMTLPLLRCVLDLIQKMVSL